MAAKRKAKQHAIKACGARGPRAKRARKGSAATALAGTAEPAPRLSPAPPAAGIAEVPRDTGAIQATAAKERSSYDGDTASKLYLREIRQLKLLTPLEEIELPALLK